MTGRRMTVSERKAKAPVKHTHTHTHTRARAHTHTHTHTHTHRVHTQIADVHIHTHTHTRARAPAHTHKHTHIRIVCSTLYPNQFLSSTGLSTNGVAWVVFLPSDGPHPRHVTRSKNAWVIHDPQGSFMPGLKLVQRGNECSSIC